MRNVDTKEKIPDRYFIFVVVILGLYLLFRLLNQANMMVEFPIDNKANDISSHIAKLYFLKVYGIHNYIPNWYNGNYQLLKYYSPGWYLFSLPIIYVVENPLVATYLSISIIYILLFLACLLLGRSQSLSKIKSITIFLFTFANPIAIGYFLRLGKLPELFSWIWFILLFTLLIYYKDKMLDKYFLVFVPLAVFLFYSHILFFIIYLIILVSFFIIKTNKERLYIVLLMILVLILASYFLVPLYTNIIGQSSVDINALERITYPQRLTNIIGSFFTPLLFIGAFLLYFYGVEHKKKELLFYLVPLIVAILLFTGLLIHIPFFNKPESKSYDIFFIFLSSFLLMKSKINKDSVIIKNLLKIGLIIVPILGVLLSTLITSFFIPHTADINNVIKLLDGVDGNLAILGVPNDIHPGAIYSYAAVYNNITSISGWDISGISNDYTVQLEELSTFLKIHNCNGFKIAMSNLNVQNVVSSDNYCDFLSKCGLTIKDYKGNFCLYSFNN